MRIALTMSQQSPKASPDYQGLMAAAGGSAGAVRFEAVGADGRITNSPTKLTHGELSLVKAPGTFKIMNTGRSE